MDLLVLNRKPKTDYGHSTRDINMVEGRIKNCAILFPIL
jgi:hypothetical protein